MSEKTKNILLGVLIVGLVSMTVAYAALSQTLNINGTAKVQKLSDSWNVHFQEVSSNAITKTGYANVDTTASLVMSGTLVTTPTVTFKAPGDSVTFYFDVVNEGEINAILKNYSALSLGTPQYTEGGTMTAADLAIANAVTYSLTYANDNAITVDSDRLAATNGVAHLKLTITLPSSVEELPSKEISFPSITASLTYEQDVASSN